MVSEKYSGGSVIYKQNRDDDSMKNFELMNNVIIEETHSLLDVEVFTVQSFPGSCFIIFH